MGKFWALLLAPALIYGQTGTNQPVPSKVIHLTVPANGVAVAEASRSGFQGLTTLKAIIALPEGFHPGHAWPVLLVTAPSGASAVRSVSGYTNIALSQGWVVAAVDGPKVSFEKDNNLFAWGMISSLLDQLRRSWPQSKQWPFACAGFSGGGKRAAMTAAQMARQGDVVAGVFMGGCNDDRATDGFHVFRPGQAFLNVPFFLSNGTRDPIAGPAHAAEIKQSMERTGFGKIRMESYDGQHRLNTNHVKVALDWFRPPPKRALGILPRLP